MQKQLFYLVIMIVIAFAAVAVTGEYFAYKYYSLVAAQTALTKQSEPLQNISSNQNQTQLTAKPLSENAITSFMFQDPLAVGSINQANHTIDVTVPPDTGVINLTPTIEIAPDVTLSPGSGTSQDFMNPVTYTATSQDGSTQKYTVTVNVASVLQPISDEKSIISFKLSDLKIDGVVDNTNYSITVVVPDGTDLTKLSPTITVSPHATIAPASGLVQDFSNPVMYTLTAQNGSTQAYKVTVVQESSSG